MRHKTHLFVPHKMTAHFSYGLTFLNDHSGHTCRNLKAYIGSLLGLIEIAEFAQENGMFQNCSYSFMLHNKLAAAAG